jgi:hypothetical protein
MGPEPIMQTSRLGRGVLVGFNYLYNNLLGSGTLRVRTHSKFFSVPA